MPAESPVEVVEIAANLDDAPPEILGHALSVLLDEGALDAWTTAIGMKRGRPGVCLSLLCRPADRDRLARRVVGLTGSFGVRYRPWDRLVLDRRHERVETPFGTLRVKLGSLDGRVVVAQPEFGDVERCAAEHGVSPREVMAAAQAAASALCEGGGAR